MDNRIKIVFLWLVLIVCMILHFDYHISKLVYGMDVRIKNADGSIPAHLVFIRTAFHFLPLLYIAVVLWFDKRIIRLLHLILAGFYTLSHAFHFIGELHKGDNPSQMILLGITALLAILLTVASFRWFKEARRK